MKILSAEMLRQADIFTIENEPVSSIALMERASSTFFNWVTLTRGLEFNHRRIAVVCGNGNNGGDGLVIARLFAETASKVEVFIIKILDKPTDEFDQNFKSLFNMPQEVPIHFIKSAEDLPDFSQFDLTIDAIIGTGISRPIEGLTAELIEAINMSAGEIISVDVPSGLFPDKHTEGVSVHATDTFTFETPKLAFFFAENEYRVGEWTCLSIGLHPDFIKRVPTPYFTIDNSNIKAMMKTRTRFSHKGTFGHALIIAGSYGKMGAAILATRACLRSGVGLVTTHVPKCGYEIMQTSTPEAMVSIDEEQDAFAKVDGFDKYDVIGIGPGITTKNRTRNGLCYLMKHYDKPMVLDADALNILAAHPDWLQYLPKGSILTPHPKESERLFGSFTNSFDRLETLRQKAQELDIIIVLKGAYTCVVLQDGTCHFNTTGNPGMSTAGSGDVLTGILTSLLAQGYTPREAAMIGVYWHGKAGDIAADRHGQMSMVAGDITKHLGRAWQEIQVMMDFGDGFELPF